LQGGLLLASFVVSGLVLLGVIRRLWREPSAAQ